MHCPICGEPAAVHRRIGTPIYRCGSCRTRFIPGEPVPPRAAERLDEERRVAALAPMRRDAARVILSTVASLRPGRQPGRLLDVGCSYGWFLEVAEADGWDARGIDPDERSVRQSQAAGRQAQLGWFPQDLDDPGPYDAITFNDVFEHLPDPHSVLRECAVRLAGGGLVVLNMPSNRGPLYRLAEAAAAAGTTGPLRRLFQLSFPCPHAFYYGPDGVSRLAGRSSFRVLCRHGLPTLSFGTVRSRIAMDRSLSHASLRLQALGVAALLPALRAWPVSDLEVYYLQKKDSHGS